MTQEEKLTGSVKWFSRLKGYGFISPDEGDEEVFVHFSAIADRDGYRNLEAGQRVSYTLHDFGKGAQAQNVCSLNSAMPMSDYAQFR